MSYVFTLEKVNILVEERRGKKLGEGRKSASFQLASGRPWRPRFLQQLVVDDDDTTFFGLKRQRTIVETTESGEKEKVSVLVYVLIPKLPKSYAGLHKIASRIAVEDVNTTHDYLIRKLLHRVDASVTTMIRNMRFYDTPEKNLDAARPQLFNALAYFDGGDDSLLTHGCRNATEADLSGLQKAILEQLLPQLQALADRINKQEEQNATIKGEVERIAKGQEDLQLHARETDGRMLALEDYGRKIWTVLHQIQGQHAPPAVDDNNEGNNGGTGYGNVGSANDHSLVDNGSLADDGSLVDNGNSLVDNISLVDYGSLADDGSAGFLPDDDDAEDGGADEERFIAQAIVQGAEEEAEAEEEEEPEEEDVEDGGAEEERFIAQAIVQGAEEEEAEEEEAEEEEAEEEEAEEEEAEEEEDEEEEDEEEEDVEEDVEDGDAEEERSIAQAIAQGADEEEAVEGGEDGGEEGAVEDDLSFFTALEEEEEVYDEIESFEDAPGLSPERMHHCVRFGYKGSNFFVGLVSHEKGSQVWVIPVEQIQLGGEPKDGSSLAYVSGKVMVFPHGETEPALFIFDWELEGNQIKSGMVLDRRRLHRDMEEGKVDFTAPLPAAVFWRKGDIIPVSKINCKFEVKHGVMFDAAYQFPGKLEWFLAMAVGPPSANVQNDGGALSPIAE